MGRPVEHIADWLSKLGLGQYASSLPITTSTFPSFRHLTDEDLKKLGISLGHRRKIFAAINEGFALVQPLAEAERHEEPKAPTLPSVATLPSYSQIWWVLEAVYRLFHASLVDGETH